jgi:hypothetical protein
MPIPISDISKVLSSENDKDKKQVLKAVERIEKKLQKNQHY